MEKLFFLGSCPLNDAPNLAEFTFVILLGLCKFTVIIHALGQWFLTFFVQLPLLIGEAMIFPPLESNIFYFI